MTAATSAYTDTLVKLTGKHIADVDARVQKTQVSNGFERFVWSFFDKLTAPRIERIVVTLTDQTIWFEGAFKRYWDENLDVRPHIAKLVPQLEGLKASLLNSRKSLLRVSDVTKNTSATRSYAALKAFAVASSDLFDAIEAFRWTLMELEANYSPIDEGYTASTPDEVAQLFKRIQQEA